jgi:hypothetical protein
MGFQRPQLTSRRCSLQLPAPSGAFGRFSLSAYEKDAVIDAEENFENAPLLGSISSCDEISRGSTAEDIARRIHPTTCFGFVAEYFQRPAPHGIGARVLKLAGELFGWSWAVHVAHNPNFSPVPLNVGSSPGRSYLTL